MRVHVHVDGHPLIQNALPYLVTSRSHTRPAFTLILSFTALVNCLRGFTLQSKTPPVVDSEPPVP